MGSQHGEIFLKQQNTEIAGDHPFEITPLRQRLQKKYYMPWQSASQDDEFGTLLLIWTTFLMPKNLPNTLVDFQDFQKNYLLTKLKIT